MKPTAAVAIFVFGDCLAEMEAEKEYQLGNTLEVFIKMNYVCCHWGCEYAPLLSLKIQNQLSISGDAFRYLHNFGWAQNFRSVQSSV